MSTEQHVPVGSGICRKHLNQHQCQIQLSEDQIDVKVSTSSLLNSIQDIRVDPLPCLPDQSSKIHPDDTMTEYNIAPVLEIGQLPSDISGSQQSDSQEIQLSQVSNWSSSSENLSYRKKSSDLKKVTDVMSVKRLVEELGYAFPESLLTGINPKSLPRVLKSQIKDPSDVIICVIYGLLIDTPDDTKSQFCSNIMMSLVENSKRPDLINLVGVALNVLESFREYYQFALNDTSRNGIAVRKVLLESVSGKEVREMNQLSYLASVIGAGRQSLINFC